MHERDPKILLALSDPDAVETIVESLCRRLDAQITCVADPDTCIETDMFEPHDLVIADLELDGLSLAEQLLVLRSRPIILVGTHVDPEETIEAMRLGVKDMFVHPYDVEELATAAERVIRGYQIHRRHGARYRRMRELVRRAIRERRELNQRVDLICRDLVDAQRRLVQRVMAVEQKDSPDGRRDESAGFN